MISNLMLLFELQMSGPAPAKSYRQTVLSYLEMQSSSRKDIGIWWDEQKAQVTSCNVNNCMGDCDSY